MHEEITKAHFVLCICSRAYRDRAEHRGGTAAGRGVRWEGAIVTNEMYSDLAAGNRKFIAVVLDDRPADEIPYMLFPVARTHYRCPAGDERLYRRLTEQPETVAPPLGEAVPLPPRGTPPAGGSERRRGRVLLAGPAVHPAFQARPALTPRSTPPSRAATAMS
jgi:hypothetical protein